MNTYVGFKIGAFIKYRYTGPALSQLETFLPIGPRAQFYRPWCRLTGNLGRPKLGCSQLVSSTPTAGPVDISIAADVPGPFVDLTGTSHSFRFMLLRLVLELHFNLDRQ